MTKGASGEIETRRGAFEDAFYREGTEAERDRLRVAAEERVATQALALVSGIADLDLLERLAGLGIRAETLVALALLPLVEVAWADGEMDAHERDAVRSGAISSGIREGSPSLALLEIWIAERPPPDLYGLWREFTRALCRKLDGEQRARFGENLVGRARRVAESAGALTGRGDRVSDEEAAVLADLRRAFAD